MPQKMIFTCDEGHTSVTENVIDNTITGRCEKGHGSWQQYYEVPFMDIVAVIIVLMLAASGFLGFIAGQQR